MSATTYAYPPLNPSSTLPSHRRAQADRSPAAYMFRRTAPYGHASAHVLSGRLLLRPLHSSFPQSWHGLLQNARPPLPLHSFEPHLQQWRTRLCSGSAIPGSGVPSMIENVRFIELAPTPAPEPLACGASGDWFQAGYEYGYGYCWYGPVGAYAKCGGGGCWDWGVCGGGGGGGGPALALCGCCCCWPFTPCSCELLGPAWSCIGGGGGGGGPLLGSVTPLFAFQASWYSSLDFWP